MKVKLKPMSEAPDNKDILIYLSNRTEYFIGKVERYTAYNLLKEPYEEFTVSVRSLWCDYDPLDADYDDPRYADMMWAEIQEVEE